MTAAVKTSDYLRTFSDKWWLNIKALPYGWEKIWREREISVRATFHTFRAIVNQVRYLLPLTSSLMHLDLTLG